jgi:hypothetical protein
MAGLGFTPPRRPLPRTVAPAADETLRCYLQRLAAANRLDSEALRFYLTGDRRLDRHVPIDVLAAVAGQPALSLRYAILELSSADELAGLRVAARPRPGGPARPHCTHCTAARGHQSLVWAANLHEDVVCERHRRWIGDGQDADRSQLDISPAPDIVHANRRHRRLIRRHGRPVVLVAFCDAGYIVSRWHHRHEHDHDFHRLLDLLGADDRPIPETSSTAQAARYPQIVALTRLLASASWRCAGNGHWPQQQAFLANLRRTVAPGYEWTLDTPHGRSDPLAELFSLKRYQPDVAGADSSTVSDDDNETAHRDDPPKRWPSACASAMLPGRVRVPTIPPLPQPTRARSMTGSHSRPERAWVRRTQQTPTRAG